MDTNDQINTLKWSDKHVVNSKLIYSYIYTHKTRGKRLQTIHTLLCCILNMEFSGTLLVHYFLSYTTYLAVVCLLVFNDLVCVMF